MRREFFYIVCRAVGRTVGRTDGRTVGRFGLSVGRAGGGRRAGGPPTPWGHREGKEFLLFRKSFRVSLLLPEPPESLPRLSQEPPESLPRLAHLFLPRVAQLSVRRAAPRRAHILKLQSIFPYKRSCTPHTPPNNPRQPQRPPRVKLSQKANKSDIQPPSVSGFWS